MELTKEQQRIIDRYKMMPGFLQGINLMRLKSELERSGIEEAEVIKLIFNNSSKNTIIKYFHELYNMVDSMPIPFQDTWGDTRNDINDGRKECLNMLKKFFRDLSTPQQEKVLKKELKLKKSNVYDVIYIDDILGEASIELQEKYFDKLRDKGNYLTIEKLSPEVRKAHEEEILNSAHGYDLEKLLDVMWDDLSTESKSKSFKLYLKNNDSCIYVNFEKWGEINEQGQQENIEMILKLRESNFIAPDQLILIWNLTKSNIQMQYFDRVISAINPYLLPNIWEGTNDIVQNSPIGRNFFESASQDERDRLYRVSNGKLQEEVLVQDIEKYINKDYDKDSPLLQKIIYAKDEVYEMNFQYLLKNIEQNAQYLAEFLKHCPSDIKYKYSDFLSEYISNTDLDGFGEARKDILASIIQYVDFNSSYIIFEKIFSDGYDETYWKFVNKKYQKEIFSKLIDDGKCIDKTDRFSSLYNMMKFENFEEAKIYFIKYFEKYNPEKKDVALSRLEKIYQKNNEIVSSINFEFISSDLMDTLTEEQILRITLYPEAQKKLVEYKDNKAFIKAFMNMIKTKENWTLVADEMFKKLASGQYDALLKDINEITPEYYDNLCLILSKQNYFGITNKEDIEKYFDADGKRNQMLLAIMRGEDIEIPYMSKLSQDEIKRFAVSEYLYGMDLKELRKYVERFQGVQGLKMESSEYIKNLITELSMLDNASVEELDKIIKDITEGRRKPTDYLKDIHLESKAVNLFREEFEGGIYNPPKSENDKIEPIMYNESQISVYRIHDDFKMLVRVEGAYSGLHEITDYEEYYNTPRILQHGNCESIIGQDQIGLARNEDGKIVVGYASLPQNSLLVSAPYDLGTTNESLAPLHDRLSRSIKFYGLQETIDNTRHTHNETVMERLVVDEHGNVQKLRPSYLIWVEDRKTDKFPPEFIEPPEGDENAMSKYKAQVHLWEETQKAAHELGIPIVVINREECAEKELLKIQEMQKMLRGEIEIPKDKSIVDIAKEAIVKFENNAVGLTFAEKNLKAQYFTQAQREELISTIENVLRQIPETDYEKRYEYFSQITEIIRQESSKNSSMSSVGEDRDRYYAKLEKTLGEELIKYGVYLGKENNIDFNINEEMEKIFETDIKAISGTNYYNANKEHSIEHVEKTMLFSLILAQNERLDDKDTRVLLAATAFHDSYRAGNDGNAEHAIRKC